MGRKNRRGTGRTLQHALIRCSIALRSVPILDWGLGVLQSLTYFRTLFRGQVANPPSFIKYRMIRQLQRTTGIRTFVETGTYFGDTCYRVRNIFSRIISIEIDDALYTRAQQRLHKHTHIELIKGDCLRTMPKIVGSLRGPAIWFLDAHYSGGETGYGTHKDPIIQSLRIIARSSYQHAILIDDLRTFDGTFVHIFDLLRTARGLFPRHSVMLYNDMIVLLPRQR